MPAETSVLHAAARALLIAADIDGPTARRWLNPPRKCQNGHLLQTDRGRGAQCRQCLAARKVQRLEKQLAEARKAAAAEAA